MKQSKEVGSLSQVILDKVFNNDEQFGFLQKVDIEKVRPENRQKVRDFISFCLKQAFPLAIIDFLYSNLPKIYSLDRYTNADSKFLQKLKEKLNQCPPDTKALFLLRILEQVRHKFTNYVYTENFELAIRTVSYCLSKAYEFDPLVVKLITDCKKGLFQPSVLEYLDYVRESAGDDSEAEELFQNLLAKKEYYSKDNLVNEIRRLKQDIESQGYIFTPEFENALTVIIYRATNNLPPIHPNYMKALNNSSSDQIFNENNNKKI